MDRGLKAVKIGQNNNPNLSKGRLYTISFKPDDKTIPRGIGDHSKTLLLLPGSNCSEPLAFIGEVIKKIKTNKQTNCTGIFLCPTLSTTITSYKKKPKQVELRLVVLWGGGLRAQWREIRTGDKVGKLPTRQGVQCCPDINSAQTGFADVFVGVDLFV